MQILETLRQAGLRRTAVREQVFQALLAANRPLSHQEIGKRLRARRLDRVTLYRTLSTLQRSGLVHGVLGVDGTQRFSAHQPAGRGCPANHAHFLCVRCGSMQCLAGQVMPKIAVPRGAQVLGKQLVVFGRCRGCRSIVDRGRKQ